MERVGVEYDPRKDTCLRAFVRMLAACAEGEGEGEGEGA